MRFSIKEWQDKYINEGNGRNRINDEFFKMSRQQFDASSMSKFLNSLIKKGSKIPSKDLKELKDMVKEYAKLEKDSRIGTDDMYDHDYEITELENDWFDSLGELADKGII